MAETRKIWKGFREEGSTLALQLNKWIVAGEAKGSGVGCVKSIPDELDPSKKTPAMCASFEIFLALKYVFIPIWLIKRYVKDYYCFQKSNSKAIFFLYQKTRVFGVKGLEKWVVSKKIS